MQARSRAARDLRPGFFRRICQPWKSGADQTLREEIEIDRREFCGENKTPLRQSNWIAPAGSCEENLGFFRFYSDRFEFSSCICESGIHPDSRVSQFRLRRKHGSGGQRPGAKNPILPAARYEFCGERLRAAIQIRPAAIPLSRLRRVQPLERRRK